MIRKSKRALFRLARMSTAVLVACRVDYGPHVPESELVDELGYSCAAPCECRGAAHAFAGSYSPECEAMIETWVSDAQASAREPVYSQQCAESLRARMIDFGN